MLRCLLFILSLIYGGIVRLLVFFYLLKPYSLKCKVISVGNITWGGTGKTPLVEYIAELLKQKGRKIAILSRGYKRRPGVDRTQPGYHCAALGDEPYMLSRRFPDMPVLVGSDRVRAAKLAIAKYAVDTVVLDDGFQQWRLKKDLEIIAIDASNPFGSYHLIPRGILREPLSSLKRADIFVLTKGSDAAAKEDLKNYLSRINPRSDVVEAIYTPEGFYNVAQPDKRVDTESLRNKGAALVSGVADPGGFEALAAGQGVRIGLCLRFPDHYHYSTQDLERIIRESRDKGIGTVITTEKDAAKLASCLCSPACCDMNFFFLRIELKIIKDEERFINRLLSLYSF